MSAPEVSRCRSCGEPILWAVTVNGKRMPLDEQPSPTGTFVLDETRTPPLAEYARPFSVGDRFTSHFATCIDAEKFRRPR